MTIPCQGIKRKCFFICQKKSIFMNGRKEQIQHAVEKFISLVRDFDGVIEVGKLKRVQGNRIQ
ncbi:MAG: hypothetical protein C3F06_03340 [Candidatus Methanoperedenaceae archaeon]|nr:MAG: hypothetical protein C3F06_03340 [Candidatus Methanoperedenaceae archaeon]